MTVLVDKSLPAWGVWIEISLCCVTSHDLSSLPAWGVWIEIKGDFLKHLGAFSRSPHGECGLKYFRKVFTYAVKIVAPRMGSVD